MTRDPAPTVDLRHLLDLLLGLTANLTVLLGVVAWGWSPGNVWIAFLLESVSVGVTTALRLHRLGPDGTWMDHQFWMVWYGGFTLVQGIFVAITAGLTGVRPDHTLAIPIALVLVRASAEAVDIMSGPPQRRRWMLVGPITRMVVLHLGVILGFGLALAGAAGGILDRPVVSGGGWTLTGAVAPVAVLMAVKTLAEVAVGAAWAVRVRTTSADSR